MAKTKTTRHYIVRDKETNKPLALIDATSVAQARSHMSQKMHVVAYAEQKDMMEAVKAGIESEKAGPAEEDPAA